MSPRSIATVSCVALGLAACMTSAVGSKGPQHVHASDNARATGRFIPAGQQLSVRIDNPLDTGATAPGTGFTAVVQQAVNDNSGQVLIPEGARLRGYLNSVSGTTGERLRLRFEGIDTVLGPSPISARVDRAQYGTYAGIPRITAYPYGWGGGPGYYGWYGGWGYYDYDVYVPREVHLPAGAVLNLTLTRPLAAPGQGSFQR